MNHYFSSTPRPNLRRVHPLDDYELAMTDDGKTMQEEADASMRMLTWASVYALIVGSLLAWWWLS